MTYSQLVSASKNFTFGTDIYAATLAEDGKVYVFNSGDYLADIENARNLLNHLQAYLSHIDAETISTFNDALLKERLAENEKPFVPKKEAKKTFIYLMFHKSTGLHKIGHSINPEVREGTLNACDPEVELIHHFPAFKETERVLHEKHKDKRVRGEWFRLTSEDVKEIVDQTFEL